jgi:hypothetical protein
MKGRFPPDLFVVVLGPILVALIVFGLGSIIFHAEQLRGSVAAYGIAIAVIVFVLGVGFLRRRRRH